MHVNAEMCNASKLLSGFVLFLLPHMFAVVYLVVQHPAHVFEVAVIEISRTVDLHP